MALQMGADGELVPLQPEAVVDLETPAAEPVPQE
jgi:hypothetical protein